MRPRPKLNDGRSKAKSKTKMEKMMDTKTMKNEGQEVVGNDLLAQLAAEQAPAKTGLWDAVCFRVAVGFWDAVGAVFSGTSAGSTSDTLQLKTRANPLFDDSELVKSSDLASYDLDLDMSFGTDDGHSYGSDD